MRAVAYILTRHNARILLARASPAIAFFILAANPVIKELTAIYIGRGLDPALAQQVAEQLMAHDVLGAHARDELGISATLSARANAGCIGVGWFLRC